MTFSRSTNFILVFLLFCTLLADYSYTSNFAIELEANCASELTLNNSGYLICEDSVSPALLASQK